MSSKGFEGVEGAAAQYTSLTTVAVESASCSGADVLFLLLSAAAVPRLDVVATISLFLVVPHTYYQMSTGAQRRAQQCDRNNNSASHESVTKSREVTMC